MSNTLKLLFMAVFIPLHFLVYLIASPILMGVFILKELYEWVDGLSYKEVIMKYLNGPEDV